MSPPSPASTNQADANAIVAWLIAEGPRLTSLESLLHEFCMRLRDAGAPVDRSTLGAPILHPVAQSTYVFWNVEDGPHIRWFVYTPESLRALEASPIYAIYTRGEGASVRLDRPEERAQYPVCADLWDEGYQHYLALPVRFSNGEFKTLTFATRADGGFTARQEALFDATLPALSLVFETFINRNTAATLMETYVGKRAGRRVLDGEIARGDGSRIDAIIWYSDLRDFTILAQSRDEAALLALLNDYFERVTDAVDANSGEVLKFIGDAVLAVFPYDDDIARAVANAETAAITALGAQESEYRFGVGLHPGAVFYGNVGGGRRLDFTVIGHAVNVASRIESLCRMLDRPLLASAAFAKLSAREWKGEGRHDLKGVPEAMEIFSLARG